MSSLVITVDGFETERFKADKNLNATERRMYIKSYAKFHQISHKGIKIKDSK